MQRVRRTPGSRGQTETVPSYPKIQLDLAEYEQKMRAATDAGSCLL